MRCRAVSPSPARGPRAALGGIEWGRTVGDVECSGGSKEQMSANSGADSGGTASDFVAGRYRRYTAYKDSEIEWLGKVPAHWEVRMLKHIGDLRAGAGFPDVEQGDTTQQIPFFKVGDMGAIGNTHEMLEWQHTVSQSTARRLRAHVLPPETIVFAKVGAALLLNRRRILVRPSCIDNNMMGFMPRICNPKWAVYWLSGLDLGGLANPGAVPSVNEGQMRETPVCVPPATEQRAIATFLDRETAKIDALVAKKGRLIELLQEKRSALITRAVTKGLDPDVPMQDSGVEWLGEIPVHWRIRKLKRWASLVQTGSTSPTNNPLYFEEGTVPWHGPSSFSSDLLLRPATRKVAEGAVRDRVARIFDKGSTMIVTIRATIGRFGFINEPSSCNQQITAVTFNSEDVFARYAGYQMKRFEPILAGIAPSTTLPILDRGQIGHLPFFGPPMSEQRAIAAHLDRETAKIDALVAMVREAIDRLKELRTALVSAVVTGKIDVRETAA